MLIYASINRTYARDPTLFFFPPSNQQCCLCKFATVIGSFFIVGFVEELILILTLANY